MKTQTYQSNVRPDEFVVELTGCDGGVTRAVFTGDDAQGRAIRYAVSMAVANQ